MNLFLPLYTILRCSSSQEMMIHDDKSFDTRKIAAPANKFLLVKAPICTRQPMNQYRAILMPELEHRMTLLS